MVDQMVLAQSNSVSKEHQDLMKWEFYVCNITDIPLGFFCISLCAS